MKSILDPTFRYTPSFETDVKKTFARVRRAQRIVSENLPQRSKVSLAAVTANVVYRIFEMNSGTTLSETRLAGGGVRPRRR
jgi:hypothetical protein